MKRYLFLVFGFWFLFVPLCVHSQESAAQKGEKIITTDELKKMYDTRKDFLLINTLSPIEYAEERIKGSVNIPYTHLKNGMAKLPENKNKMLVFYCKGPKCTKSKKTADLAVSMGYKNVLVYSEGLPEWIKRGYPADILSVYPKPEVPVVNGAELKAMLDRKDDFILVDLRDENDRKAGWIKGSKHMDMEELDTRYQELPKDRKIVLQCLFGKQGYMAARFLVSKGYRPQNLVKLDGGFVDGWLKAGYPVER